MAPVGEKNTAISGISENLDQIVKELETAQEAAKSSYLKTALKTYKGTVKRVANDLREMSGEVAA